MATTLVRPIGTSSAEEYVTLVGKALAADRFDLDDFRVLSELPAVERFAAAHPHVLLSRGKAIRMLLDRADRAVAEVATAYAEDTDRALRRIATSVHLRYQEGKSVKDIAQLWGHDRTVLSRQLSRRALQVVAHRFLPLAEHLRWEKDGATPAAKAS